MEGIYDIRRNRQPEVIMKLSAKHKPEPPASELYSDNILLNNKGIALVMVMILSLISLAIMSGLIYMVTSGTQVSGIEKRYRQRLKPAKAVKILLIR